MTREEAIKEIRGWDFLNEKETEAIQTLIPELRESEDERIRKILVNLVSYRIVPEKEDREKCLAYLEKQKEQKPVGDGTRAKIVSRATSEKQVVLVSESDGNAEIGWDTRSLEDAKNLLEYGISFINKQLGVKPAEWSEEDEKKIGRLRSVVNQLASYTDSLDVNGDYCAGDYAELDTWLKFLPSKHKMDDFTVEEFNAISRAIELLYGSHFSIVPPLKDILTKMAKYDKGTI